MNIDPTFRLEAYEEAKACKREADKCTIEQPEYWANHLGAILNVLIACIPDSVAAGLVHQSMEESLARDHVKKKVKEARGGGC